MIEGFKGIYKVFAVDSQSPGVLITNVGMLNEPAAVGDISIEEYLEAFENALPNVGFTIEKSVTQLKYPAGRLVRYIDMGENSVKQLIYLFIDDGVAWEVVFTTPASEYDSRLPVFEEIANSIQFTTQATPTANTPLLSPSQPADGEVRTSTKDQMPLVFISAGPFIQGSSLTDGESLEVERPQRTVTLDAFWIDKYEVTNEQYAFCVEDGVCVTPSRDASFNLCFIVFVVHLLKRIVPYREVDEPKEKEVA